MRRIVKQRYFFSCRQLFTMTDVSQFSFKKLSKTITNCKILIKFNLIDKRIVYFTNLTKAYNLDKSREMAKIYSNLTFGL